MWYLLCYKMIIDMVYCFMGLLVINYGIKFFYDILGFD